MRRAIAAFFLNLYHFFAGKTVSPPSVDSDTRPPKPLHPQLLAALLGVARIDDRESWEHRDHLASQVRDGYREVETLCGQVYLSVRDLLSFPHLDVFGITGKRHETLTALFGIKLQRSYSEPITLKYNRLLDHPNQADPNGMVILDRQVLDELMVTETVVTYGNPAAVAANLEGLELLLRRGEVQEFGICTDGITYFVVLRRDELEVVICSRS